MSTQVIAFYAQFEVIDKIQSEGMGIAPHFDSELYLPYAVVLNLQQPAMFYFYEPEVQMIYISLVDLWSRNATRNLFPSVIYTWSQDHCSCLEIVRIPK